jgi:hypothetical protein
MIDLDLNTLRMQRVGFASSINDAIDAGLETLVEHPRDYLGASLIGDECLRRIQFERLAAPAKPISGKLRRIFQRGHAGEALAVDWLTTAGFVVSRLKPDNKPLGFSVAQDRFRGHVDGVLKDGPIALEYPCIWECKVLGAKGWGSLVKNGVAKSHPKYADQISLYQLYMDLLAPALLTVVNADTMELWHELVPFDPARAQDASDRAVRILEAMQAGELLPRAADSPNYYPCTFCRFADHCWP